METKVWDRIRAKLKIKFERAGITYCQICGRQDYLSFGHRLKRRFIITEEEMAIVALICMSNPDAAGCHNKLEHGDKQVMYDTITEIYEATWGKILDANTN